MSIRFKKGIIAIFVMTMMLFLYACDKKEVKVDQFYQITFDTSGGSLIDPIELKANEKITLPKDPIKDGYTFAGWNQEIELMPLKDIVLKAIWEPKTYTITFDSDGGSEVNSIEALYLSDIKIPTHPTKDGYRFKTWDQPFPNTMPLGGLQLKAVWEVMEYSITFDTDGGSVVDSIKGDFLSSLTAPINPTKAGYTFVSWDKEFPTTMPLDGLALKAIWEVNTYKITFDTKGGSLIEDIEAPFGSELTTPQNPTKDGYVFKRWDMPFPSIMPENGLKLTAIWEEIILEDETLTETFELLQYEKQSGGNFSEYQDFDWLGDTYVLWEVINGRIDLGMSEGGNAVTIGGFGNLITQAGMGRIYGNLTDGISSLSFQARLPFSPQSTYPQGNGSDKAINVKIKVFINDELISTLQFSDDKEANKGKTFTIENLNIKGDYSLSIEISSGHRLTVDNISWRTNKGSQDEQNIATTIDFEDAMIDFDNEPAVHNIGGIDFVMKEVYTLIMHADKELPYMTEALNGDVVARFRGNSTNPLSTPTAYMYNKDAFLHVSSLSFDTRLFGSLTYFTYESEINIYYLDDTVSDFTLLETIRGLSTEFISHEIEVDKSNVKIKIEVINGTVNIDNIVYSS
ncbi:hypothetical protein JN09_000525 [Acholeplasma morum]|uniref:InlB B-repeat-containing protein n=1 Tax=Paracholeplasma morum TaxID=264637 RepID=UPI0019590AF5|nr:InlB B-repeat-containing protein [Paracholeplasma morum]MBM7453203.1 hypothetical protein [Paracholeplasma morum]